jgi:hypothetical protein
MTVLPGLPQPNPVAAMERRRRRFIETGTCPICRKFIVGTRWFVGGPGSAFNEEGAYLTPPMHQDCAKRLLKTKPETGGAAPPYYVLVGADALDVITNEDGRPYVKPRQPYAHTSCWSDGREVLNTDEIGAR